MTNWSLINNNNQLLNQFFKRFLEWMPSESSIGDQYRVNDLFFALSGMALTSNCPLNQQISPELIHFITKWIRSLSVKNQSNHIIGFLGGSAFLGINEENQVHLTMTFVAIWSLLLLRNNDDNDAASSLLNEILTDRMYIMEHFNLLKRDNGSLSSSVECKYQSDMRFIYSACMIAHSLRLKSWLLNNINIIGFVGKCLNYDGAFGFEPGSESHGASTFLALASLQLCDQLNDFFNDDDNKRKKLNLIRWLTMRQQKEGGFNGRPGKDADSCYTFWIGASLSLLNFQHSINVDSCLDFLLKCFDYEVNGYAKYPELSADPMHSFCTIAGLSIIRGKLRADVCLPHGVNSTIERYSKE